MALLLVGITAIVAYFIYRSFQKHPKLPPGPKPLPILGNLNDFPPEDTPEFQHWLAHKDLYGGISAVTVLGTTLVLIHDKKAAHELLDGHSNRTSSRPDMTMANKLCGYEDIVLCQGYSPIFHRYRKFLHRELGTTVSASEFRGIQEVEVNRQLVRALNKPEKWLQHFKTTAGATVLKMAYGYTVEPHEPDPLVELSDRMMTEFSQAAVPMAWAVDVIPALRCIPDSFPGAGFKRTARKWRKSIEATAHIPYRFVRRRMAAGDGDYQPSYVSKLIQQLERESNGSLSQTDEHAVIWTAASLYGAAADTIVITLTAFTAAMVMYPDVQRKAQEEINRVVGPNRRPTFDDRKNLPYINALVKETLRWWPIAPMGFPHTATEDLNYNGLHIPKDSTLLPAVWSFLHDPEVYPDPSSFNPDRFLPPRNEPDPAGETFGFGRRICPGRFFADAGLYLNIARSLAVFSIGKEVGEDGVEIEVDVRPTPGILMYPTSFAFRVEPRGERFVELIRGVERGDCLQRGDACLVEGLNGT